MKLVRTGPRPDWQKTVEAQGFIFHSPDNKPYWVDDRAYVLSRREAQTLLDATEELHRLCLEAVAHVIAKNLFSQLSIEDKYVDVIKESWLKGDPYLYGRFDFSYDGKTPPKMLEYNADTPTALLESAVIQYYWVQDQKHILGSNLDQFNTLQEKIIERWKTFHIDGVVHFSAMRGYPEDRVTVNFLEDAAKQAGLQTEFIYISEIGWSRELNTFVDVRENPITTLFKLYPWEMITKDKFGHYTLERRTRFIEPPWKMILSNKAILPVLWALYEGHENLLPSYYSPEPLGEKYVKKPFFSREGANITIVDGTKQIATEGIYGVGGHIYQAFAPLPDLGNGHFMIGSWVVGDDAAGVCIRESPKLITDNMSFFVPHFIRDYSDG